MSRLNRDARLGAWDERVAEFSEHEGQPLPGCIADNVLVAWPAISAHLHALVGPGGTGRVVDLGCGTGWMSRRLHAQGFDVTGIEPSARMLREARRSATARLRFIHGDHGALDALPAQVQAVLCCMVLQFVGDLHAALSLLERRVAPGGALVFAVHRPQFVHACLGAGWLFHPRMGTEQGDCVLQICRTRFPTYARTAEQYRSSCAAFGFVYRGESVPTYSQDFVAEYSSGWPVQEPEFLVMAFQKR